LAILFSGKAEDFLKAQLIAARPRILKSPTTPPEGKRAQLEVP